MRKRDRWFLFAAPVMATFTPIYQAYGANDIRLFDQAALVFLSGILLSASAVGCALAWLHVSSGWRRTALKTALLSATLLVLVDMIGGGETLMQGVQIPYGRRLVVAGLFAVLFAVLWIIRSKAPAILFAGAAALFISTVLVAPGVLVSSANAQEASANSKIVYIITDEMIGVDGIPRDIPGGEETYAAVKSLFLKHGFRLYTKAFSRHFLSQRSIPATLNFNEHDDSGYDLSQYSPESSSISFNRLRLLERWQEEGGLTIYQSGHLNWCAAVPLADCNTFPSFDVSKWEPPGEDPLEVLRSRLVAHSGIMSISFAGSYAMQAYSSVFEGYTPPYHEPVITPTFFDIHAFPGRFASFQDEVGQAKADRYFAHFLMPHAPSLLNAGCEPQTRWVSPYYLVEQRGLTGAAFDNARAEFYGWYFEQVACLVATLDGFLISLDRNAAFTDATIIIHGDHGSRISAGRQPENQTTESMIDNYSALYAIKAAGVDAGLDERQVSVQRLTSEFLGDDPIEALPPENDTVVVSGGGANDATTLVPMPLIQTTR